MRCQSLAANLRVESQALLREPAWAAER